MTVRHFLTLLDFSPAELISVLDRADQLKQFQQEELAHESLKNKVLGMIFEKSSCVLA